MLNINLAAVIGTQTTSVHPLVTLVGPLLQIAAELPTQAHVDYTSRGPQTFLTYFTTANI